MERCASEGQRFVLRRLADLAAEGPVRPEQIETVAAELGQTEAAVRAALSFYSDLHSSPNALRVCHGTSCLLAGAEVLHQELARQSECRRVHCLGHCDRSPAVLRGKDVLVHGRPEAATIGVVAGAVPPAIRCLAPQPLISRRLLSGEGVGLGKARAAGAYAALDRALRESPTAIIAAVEGAHERGRGGAGYSTAAKWRACAATPSDRRFVIANGDEGDPGSFVDRLLMECDPHAVIEGMILCGYALAAHEGIVFIRSEYPRAVAAMEGAVAEARAANILGPSVLGSSFGFDIRVFPGLGSYVCGEETALLNALEGRRGEVRLRPPHPAVAGLYGRPTVVNNVETLANVPVILTLGAPAYARFGTAASAGTKLMCLNHGFEHAGLFEVEFGTTLGELIAAAGGGRDGRRIDAVLIGGPMGSVALPDRWDVPICYTAMAKEHIQLGHGGVIALLEGTDYRALVRHWIRFLRDESCGKCVPCREGSRRADELLANGGDRAAVERLLDVIASASLCAFGQLTPNPIRELLDAFGDRIFQDTP